MAVDLAVAQPLWRPLWVYPSALGDRSPIVTSQTSRWTAISFVDWLCLWFGVLASVWPVAFVWFGPRD
jgi:hypothetical protein